MGALLTRLRRRMVLYCFRYRILDRKYHRLVKTLPEEAWQYVPRGGMPVRTAIDVLRRARKLAWYDSHKEMN